QGRRERHAAGDAADDAGRARLPRRDRRPGRRQTGRRHPHHQGRDQIPGVRERGPRRRLALAALVPLRRLQPAQRPAHAAPETHDRPLLRSRLRDGGLTMFEYAPAPESLRPQIREHYGLFIDGEFVDAADGSTFKSVNPADESALFTVAEAGEADVRTAVAAARRAHERTWGPMSGAERGKYLFRIARLLQERAREFAVAESRDNGKPIKETRDFDVPTAAQHFFYHAGWADKLAYAGLGPDPRPLGVVGQIIPWNFPLLML